METQTLQLAMWSGPRTVSTAFMRSWENRPDTIVFDEPFYAHYLNESSLSNDYYRERALDKFGWIPADDISSAAYLAEADGEDTYYPPTAPTNPTAGGSTTTPGTGALLNGLNWDD